MEVPAASIFQLKCTNDGSIGGMSGYYNTLLHCDFDMHAYGGSIDKRGGRGIGNGTYRRVSLFSYTGVPLENLLFKTVT